MAIIPASARMVVFGLLGVDFGKLGTLKRDIRHEAFDIEDEPDDRVLLH